MAGKLAERNVLLIGGGGREDALMRKLSAVAKNVFVGPGNGGTDRYANTHPLSALNPKNPKQVIEAARDTHAQFVIIGPEDPLIAGLADHLRAENIPAFGPGKDGAILEGSKAYATDFMQRYDIPHPTSGIFENAETAHVFVAHHPWWETNDGGMVVKADGLAGGKGVIVCDTESQTHDAIEQMMVKKEFGDAGTRIVIQEKLNGFEVSLMLIVSGNKYILLPYSEDHKQIYDGDKGPNTGGMGVLAPHPLVTPQLMEEIRYKIINRTMRGLREENIDFRGVLYPGIMVTPNGPKVLEYNVRFGDPETEAVVPLLDTKNVDFFQVLESAATGNLLFDGAYPTRSGSSVVVTLAAENYPSTPRKGAEILGFETIVGKNGVVAYHAATTKKSNGGYETAGGRVLMVAGVGNDPTDARSKVYGVIGPHGIHFAGMQYRTDIGDRKRE